ncbi:MAG: hypothetical protein Q4G58_11855 [bacterium]|nr:hypothetical protein [bacterium]
MKRVRRCLVFVIVEVLLLTGCSRSNVPDNAHDILSVAYSNMGSLSSYSATATFQLSMKYTESLKQTKVVSKITGVTDPMEIMVEHRTDGEPASTYDYIYEKDGQVYRTSFGMKKWSSPVKVEQALLESLKSPVLFGIYLLDINSFEIVKRDKKNTLVEGKISKEHLENALKEAGALKQFSLTSLPKEVLEKIPEIKVRAWVDNTSVTITKLEVDMKESLQALTAALIGEDSIASAEVTEGNMILEEIKRNEVTPVSIPSDIKNSLQETIN